MKNIKKLNFSKVYDLQNSSRTAFYKRIIFQNASKDIWSSTETTLPAGTTKQDFDKDSVLFRFDHQLKSSGINTVHTLKPDFKWSSSDISQIKNYYELDKYIVLFPFCSPHLTSKKWPYYNELINLINEKYNNTYKVVLAPGPNEIKETSDIKALSVHQTSGTVNVVICNPPHIEKSCGRINPVSCRYNNSITSSCLVIRCLIKTQRSSRDINR